MGDMAEDFRALREYRKEERAAAQKTGQAAILALTQDGFKVQQLTDYHYRVDGRLDLFPIRRRYHDIRTGRRGGYQDPKQVAERILREKKEKT